MPPVRGFGVESRMHIRLLLEMISYVLYMGYARTKNHFHRPDEILIAIDSSTVENDQTSGAAEEDQG